VAEHQVYAFGDLSIAADFPLADLPRRDVPTSHWTVRLGDVPSRQHAALYHTWTDASGRPLVAFARHDRARIIIEHGALARFLVDPAHRSILCEPLECASLLELGQLLAHDVLPLVAGVDRLTLHGSAVAAGERAIAFAGGSGAGKSTLALRLAQRGSALLSDDVIILDTRSGSPEVVPTEMPVRLWTDARRTLVGEPLQPGERKRALTLAEAGVGYARGRTRLQALFLVGEASHRRAERLSAQAAVAAVMEHAFVLTTDDRRAAERLFHQVSDVVGATRVFRLPAPPEFADLDPVLDAVMLDALG
jgi:hypothetical protein